MKEHYQLSNQEYTTLSLSGIGIPELYKALPEFNYCGGKLGLMHFIDSKGSLAGKIPNAIFESLDPPDKISVLEYEDYVNGL